MAECYISGMTKKLENLQNQVFGRLTVMKYGGLVQDRNKRASVWECKCCCGNTCVVKHTNLIRGGTKSCGCLRRQMATKNLTGHIFGDLTVIKLDGYKTKQTSRDKEVVWECVCDCGNSHLVTTTLLCNGHVTSCGCRKKGKKVEDLTDKTFGELTVVGFHERKNKRTFWWCECSCGNKKSLDAHHLKSGNQRSCGCRRGGWKHGLSKDKKLYHQYLMSDPVRKLRTITSNVVRNRIKSTNGTKCGSTWNYLPYTPQQLKEYLEKLWEPWMNWDNYGGRPNDSRETWWIDHIKPHSSFPYKSLDDPLFIECWSLDNLRPLEKIANISKGDRNVS